MSLENEVKKLTEQVSRVADLLEQSQATPPVAAQQQTAAAEAPPETLTQPAQTEGKAERQPSKGKGRGGGKKKQAESQPQEEPAPGGGDAGEDQQEETEAPQYSNAELRQIRKDLASRLTTLISQRNRSTAVKLLNEFEVGKLMEIPVDQLGAFSERLRQYEEGGE